MSNTDLIVVIIVLLLIFLIIYTKVRDQSILDTMDEIKSLLTGGTL